MRRLYPKNTPPASIPPDAEGVTWEEWRASVPFSAYDDPIGRRDLEKRRAAEEEKAAKKKGAKR